MMVDPLPERLHFIDSFALGASSKSLRVINSESRDSYLVRTLIEESISSSQLEGASTTRKDAKQMIREGRAPRDRSERMIFNNYQAMRHVIEIHDQDFTRDRILEIHRMVTDRMVTDGTLDDPSAPGRFRAPTEQVVVGDNTGEVFQIPPPADDLERRLGVLCQFANGDNSSGFLHPVLKVIILHFWLACDHPFVDGNGRTARTLFYWSMLRQNYQLFEYLSISQIIHESGTRYGRAFLYSETDENDVTYFLLYQTDVICRTIRELDEYVTRHQKSLDEAQNTLHGLAFLNHRQRELINHALNSANAVFTTRGHRTTHNISYETARKDLTDLAQRKLLRARKTDKTWTFVPGTDLRNRLQKLD
jgi:Fic family protein